MTKPLAPAAAPAALHADIAARRSAPEGVAAIRRRSDAGTDTAAATPCRHRPATSAGMDPAVAAHSEPAANAAMPPRSTRR